MTLSQPSISRARFVELAATYGGSIGRWPKADQFGAEAILQAAPELRGVLAEAGDLDALLFEAEVPRPSADLVRRIIAEAPRAKSSPSAHLRRWLWGLAAVGLLASGAAAGATVVALAPAPVDSLNGIYDQGDLGEVAALDHVPAAPSQTQDHR